MPIDELTRQVNELYAGCDCSHHTDLPDLADGDTDEMSAMLAAMVKQVWTDKGLPEGTINRQVTAAFAKKLWSGTVEGYGKDMGAVDYETPDHDMLAKLQQNVWSFSAAKNYSQLRELGNALIGENGKLRSYKQFEEAALKINNKYVKHHLKTEYNLAVAGGQMAGKWVRIQDQKDILPNLKFDAVLDNQTTALCRDLDGTVLPIDHPFWKTFYPPNHFGCRSTVRQVVSGWVTPADKIPAIDIPVMFQTNLGEAGFIFPPNHPYFKDLPEKVKDAAQEIKPITSIDDLQEVLKKLPQEYFQRGFTELKVEKRKGANGSTDMSGTVWLKKDRIDNIIDAVNTIKKGNPTELKHEDSLSTLWHEITHNRNKVGLVNLTRKETQFMELANEWVARNTLPQFMESLGGKLTNTSLTTDRSSTGYNRMVVNYDKLIKVMEADKDKVLKDVQETLFNKSYKEQRIALQKAIISNAELKLKGETISAMLLKVEKFTNKEFDDYLKEFTKEGKLLIKQ